jgi:hypothetical protein
MNLSENRCFEDTKGKRCKDYIKKFKWHLNILIMMLLYYHNWKITASKPKFSSYRKRNPNDLKFYMECNQNLKPNI